MVKAQSHLALLLYYLDVRLVILSRGSPDVCNIAPDSASLPLAGDLTGQSEVSLAFVLYGWTLGVRHERSTASY